MFWQEKVFCPTSEMEHFYLTTNLSILRDVTGLPLQNIKAALLQGSSNENAIKLHFPAPSNPSPSDNDSYIKSVKERFSNVQHVKVLAVDIKEND